MSIFSAVVVYVLIWWMVLFCTLPFNLRRTVHPKDGTMPGAPIHPHIKRKFLLTTIITTILWAIIYALIASNVVSFHDMAQKMPM